MGLSRTAREGFCDKLQVSQYTEEIANLLRVLYLCFNRINTWHYTKQITTFLSVLEEKNFFCNRLGISITRGRNVKKMLHDELFGF